MNPVKGIITREPQVQTQAATSKAAAGELQTKTTGQAVNLERHAVDTDKIAVLCDMAVHAAPKKIADPWLREAQRTYDATAGFYNQPLAVVRALSRNISPETDFDRAIREGRQKSSEHIRAAEAHLQSTRAFEEKLTQLEKKLADTAKHGGAKPPHKLAPPELSGLDKELVDMIAFVSRVKVRTNIPPEVFPEKFKEAVHWSNTWKSIAEAEPLGEARLHVQRLRDGSKNYFGAQALSSGIEHAGIGRLEDLRSMLASAKEIYPAHTYPEMQPVIVGIDAANVRARKSIEASIEADIKTLTPLESGEKHGSKLARQIRARAAKRIVNLNEVDGPAADKHGANLDRHMSAAESYAISED